MVLLGNRQAVTLVSRDATNFNSPTPQSSGIVGYSCRELDHRRPARASAAVLVSHRRLHVQWESLVVSPAAYIRTYILLPTNCACMLPLRGSATPTPTTSSAHAATARPLACRRRHSINRQPACSLSPAQASILHSFVSLWPANPGHGTCAAAARYTSSAMHHVHGLREDEHERVLEHRRSPDCELERACPVNSVS